MQTNYAELIEAACQQVMQTENGGICRLTEDCRPELGGCPRCGGVIARGAVVDFSAIDIYPEENLISFTVAQGCGKETPCRVYLKNVPLRVHRRSHAKR